MYLWFFVHIGVFVVVCLFELDLFSGSKVGIWEKSKLSLTVYTTWFSYFVSFIFIFLRLEHRVGLFLVISLSFKPTLLRNTRRNRGGGGYDADDANRQRGLHVCTFMIMIALDEGWGDGIHYD
jgi:hypothetical protein